MLLLAGGSAAASNTLEPRVGPVFDAVPCLSVLDRSRDPVLQIGYQLPYEDVERGGHELPDSRSLQFFAACRPLALGEALPAWITTHDFERARRNGDVEETPDATEIAETSERWPLPRGAAPGCLIPMHPAAARVPISCASAEAGTTWDTSNVPAGAYVIWAYTFEPPRNLWTPRPGLVLVTDDPTQVGADAVAISRIEPLAVANAELPRFVVRGCVADRSTSFDLAWIDARSSEAGDPSAWTEFARLTAGESTAFAVEFPAPHDALGAGIFVRAATAGADGWTSATATPLVVVPDSPGWGVGTVETVECGPPPPAAGGCGVGRFGTGGVRPAWLALALMIFGRARPMLRERLAARP